MSHRLVPSIYQVFMVAVEKIRVPPGLWRTFRDYAITWRHRPAVIYGLIDLKKCFCLIFFCCRLGAINLRAHIDCRTEMLSGRLASSSV